MKQISIIFITALLLLVNLPTNKINACTGISLKAYNNDITIGRTIEWAGSYLNSEYVIVPRGYIHYAYLPGTKDHGMQISTRYGYVGLAIEEKEFIAEGINEYGLAGGLFYFPKYGKYQDYNPKYANETISDLQLVGWALGNFKTIDEIKNAIKRIHIASIHPQSGTLHWRFTDKSGKQIVIECLDGQVTIFDNDLGVITNAPNFEWQMTNLNNYVNLHNGNTTNSDLKLGNINLSPMSAGSGLLGLPGDMTSPSRFVRAAFFQASAPTLKNGKEAVMQLFKILNNFDIPIGTQFNRKNEIVNIPSATQWTSATDVTNKVIYYKTMYNNEIRAIDLNKIDFEHVRFTNAPLDKTQEQKIKYIITK